SSLRPFVPSSLRPFVPSSLRPFVPSSLRPFVPSSLRPLSDPPPIIGIVGGIGAGKSTVAAILRDLGCLVCDSDTLARAALEDPAVVKRVRERWGERAIGAEGSVDRRRVADIVFREPGERQWLESVVHPWIEARRRQLFEKAPPGTPALVIDAPLLLEAGLDAQCDAVIFVDAPRELRLSRVRTSRGWTDEELALREAAQMPLDRKRERADIVIVNSGDRQRLHSDTEAALAAIVARGRRRETGSRHRQG
ncbi:MAG: dephospho-CoA kinase, partial [Phycisphaerales bacterium]|nr:dephospho-CoA kinase [Phycisphaerales bacterium]